MTHNVRTVAIQMQYATSAVLTCKLARASNAAFVKYRNGMPRSIEYARCYDDETAATCWYPANG